MRSIFSIRSRNYRCLLPAFLFLIALPAHAFDSVTLQLKWTHAFQFAGYYAAKEQGYYRAAGLEVNIKEALPGVDPVQQVLDGKAEFGVGTSSLLLQREAGKPVVALAVIFQHSAYVLIARQQSATEGIHDLVGKRVMLEPQADEILAYLRQEGIPFNRITQLEHSYDPQDLVNGKTDAMAAYVTNEPYYLDRAHFSYQTYTPRAAGIDFYGDNLFTTAQEIEAHPERVKAFREASLRGWKYAMEHPEEIIDLILAKYSQQHPRDYFQFEAKQTMALIHPELIEVGYMNPGRWRHIADTYADIGMLPRDYSLEGFLYDADPQGAPTWLYSWLTAALLLSAIAGTSAYHFARLSKALRASEERYRLIAENTRDVLWKRDLRRQCLSYVSPSVERLTGYTAKQTLERSTDEALAPSSAGTLRETVAYLTEHPEIEKYMVELEVYCKDGSTVWTEDSLSMIHDAAGRPVELLGVARNITERLRAQQDQQRFIAMVSHEFRTPLATIDGAIQRLAATAGEASETTRKRYDNIQKAVDRLTVLLDEFLTEDNLEMAWRGLHPRIISPLILLKDTMDSAESLSSEHRIGILKTDIPEILLCDSQMMRLVLRVLADNAVKYTPAGTQITLSCRTAHDQGVEFLVADNGPGIPQDELPHIFEKFFRGRGSARQSGSGLGLYMAGFVVRSHGGTLTARNRPEGGAEFRVWLPNDPATWGKLHRVRELDSFDAGNISKILVQRST